MFDILGTLDMLGKLGILSILDMLGTVGMLGIEGGGVGIEWEDAGLNGDCCWNAAAARRNAASS